MPTMLRHKPTGDLYIATQYLMERTDMEEVSEEQPKVASKPAKAPAKKAAKKQTAKKKVTEKAEETTADGFEGIFGE